MNGQFHCVFSSFFFSFFFSYIGNLHITKPPSKKNNEYITANFFRHIFIRLKSRAQGS